MLGTKYSLRYQNLMMKAKYLLKVRSSFMENFCRKFVEKGHFHDLTNKYMPWKKWKPETTRVTAPAFLREAAPPKLFSKVAKVLPKKHTQWISDLVAQHRPSYLNFEADISLDYLQLIAAYVISCFIYYHFLNSYRIITLCSAFATAI